MHMHTIHFFFYLLGRIHSAVISGSNPESKSVTVEWFEKGETKGKEVCVNGQVTKIVC